MSPSAVQLRSSLASRSEKAAMVVSYPCPRTPSSPVSVSGRHASLSGPPYLHWPRERPFAPNELAFRAPADPSGRDRRGYVLHARAHAGAPRHTRPALAAAPVLGRDRARAPRAHVADRRVRGGGVLFGAHAPARPD